MHKTVYDITKQQLEKCKTLIESACLRKRNLPAHAHAADPAASVQPAKAKEPGSPEDISCRICYSYENPVGSVTDLVSPCGCKGTIKYVHRYCLRIWRFKGKMVKDIKVCEQCFCEYKVDDERRVGQAVVLFAAALIMMSLLVLTSIFVSSSADTIKFIANDIYTYMYGNTRMVSFDKPIIICNMDAVLALKNSQNPARSARYSLHRIQAPSEEAGHFACIKKKYIYTMKNLHLIDLENCGSFTSVAALGFAYTIAFEDTPILFVNFVLSFWRVISFDKLVDWCLYGIVILYIYTKMFAKIHKYIDNYFMYMANIY
ncbi:uncharacterized protein NEMAJ01_0361 [Nematocida major]|uniref:uncharacterized protein n=1 Tax=Nematocida major TaxID=1912982 RepID=UPI00200753AA|nr:uncharacterized protein NEMAJ01_0361 [Nematocida major]KAH9385465.1 hypothetical protein NEMAJ01_0361 [Nematocida major]